MYALNCIVCTLLLYPSLKRERIHLRRCWTPATALPTPWCTRQEKVVRTSTSEDQVYGDLGDHRRTAAFVRAIDWHLHLVIDEEEEEEDLRRICLVEEPFVSKRDRTVSRDAISWERWTIIFTTVFIQACPGIFFTHNGTYTLCFSRVLFLFLSFCVPP